MIKMLERNNLEEVSTLNDPLRTLEKVKENQSPFFHSLLYIEEGKILGYLFYSKIYERIEVDQLEVEIAHRRKGIASSLMQELIALAKKQGAKNITLEVRENNVEAYALYCKCSFVPVARREKYYQGIDGLLMELEVK